MENRWSELLGEATRLLSSGEAGRAGGLFDQLKDAVETYDRGERRSLSSVWEPFLYLLGRRGYFVSGPTEIRRALEEILEMGPGFDLYDLAVALARCDRALAFHRKAPTSRALPELKSFCVETK